jgi:hypothetical protein
MLCVISIGYQKYARLHHGSSFIMAWHGSYQMRMCIIVENDVTRLRKGFLAQSLVATVVNFGGIYFLMFLFQGILHSYI